MARLARLYIPECPVLLQLQGVNGQAVFNTRDAFSVFHARLLPSAQEERVLIHAYAMTPGQVLLLMHAPNADAAGRFVQNLNRHFSAWARVQAPNVSTLWEARFKSTVVQPGVRSLKACLYVEQLPLRGRNTDDLATYPWSSFGAHAGVVNEPWLVDLPSYWGLGNTPFERQSRYRHFADHGLSQADLAAVGHCLDKGWLWGDDDFALTVAELANRSPRPRPRGRPAKVL